MKNKNLINLLEMLCEDTLPPEPKNMQDFAPVEIPINVSLDQVVDRYIVRYEKEAIPTADMYEKHIDNSINNDTQTQLENLLEKLIYEADTTTDPLPISDTNMTSEDPQAPNPEEEEHEQPIMSTPQINLQDFTRSIARLVNNYEALLNPRETIMNRAKEYIKNNYDSRTAEEFSELLEKNYSLSTLKNIKSKEDELPTSYAAGELSTEG